MKTRYIVVCLALGTISLMGCRQAEQQRQASEPPPATAAKGPAAPAEPKAPSHATPAVSPKSPVASTAAQSEQAEIETVLRNFTRAIEETNMKRAAGLVKGGKPDGDYSSFGAGIRPAKTKVGIDNLKVVVKGDRATATCTLNLDYGPTTKPMAGEEKVELVRVDNRWLIVPEESAATSSFFGVVSSMLAHPERLQRSGLEARRPPSQNPCLQNVKQLAIGLIMLASDYNSAYAVTPKGWVDEVMPYIKNKSVFHCPDLPGTDTSYSLNPGIVGKKMTDLTRVTETVLVYEGKGRKLDFRHEGKASVGFTDGHCKMITREEAKKLVWVP